MFLEKKNNRSRLLIIGVVLLSFLFLFLYLFRVAQQEMSKEIEEIIQTPDGYQEVFDTKTLISLAPRFLGFSEPQTYLILFYNNTELRPSGGFIGSYSVLTLDKGRATIHRVSGSENTNWTDESLAHEDPPAPLSMYLGVAHWYFRDANWSPDFKQSAIKTIELYNREVPNPVQNIDTVIGVTPNVLEKLLALTGDITVDGITFTEQNVVETLEYEVEFGYKKRGIAIADRKQILEKLFKKVLKELTPQVVTNLKGLIKTLEVAADEKQLQFYSYNKENQKIIETVDWDGQLQKTDGDFFMWVDANLGALKTDHAIWRELDYKLENTVEGLVVTATMNYQHNGTYDWRTSRYRTYARVFVPQGSIFKSLTIDGKEIEEQEINKGKELDKQWFGSFVSIEPGLSKKVTYTYLLPKRISAQIDQGLYTLYVQKQAGTHDIGLTLHQRFGKNISTALPPEHKKDWGDNDYLIETDLQVDRQFKIEF